MAVLPMENCPIRHLVLAILVVPAVPAALVVLEIPFAPEDLAVLLVDSSWMGAWELRVYYFLAGRRC